MYRKTFWGFATLAFGIALCIWFITSVPIKLGIDLRGGTLLTYSLDLSRIDEDRTDVANQIKDIIARRLNAYGMKEISVQVQGEEKLIVRLPGTDAESAKVIKDQIQRAGTLTFRLRSPASYQSQTALEDLEKEEQEYVAADREWVQRKRAAAEAGRTFDEERPRPPDHIARPAERFNERTGESEPIGLVALENRHELDDGEWEPIDVVSGGDLSRVYQTFDTRSSRPAVGFELKGSGAAAMGDLTGPANQGRLLCIVLDGLVLQQAEIQNQITSQGQLSGNFSDQELKGIITILRGGSLPTKPALESETTIGSAIGHDSLQSSMRAMAVALAAVLLFMAVYYAIGGLIADFAVCLNVFFLVAVVICFRQDLTLPGIAGILLTIGMAVDANILIYERVREELKVGRSLPRALSAGYQRAFWVIFDSNITTFLTGAVLFQFGTGPVRGFAVTLIIGIIASFITSIFVTRLIISFLLNRGWMKSMKMLELFGTPNFSFVSKQKPFFIGSLIVIVLSWIVVFSRGRDNFGIDFNGGAQIGVNLNRAIELGEMRAKIDQIAALHPSLFRDFNLQTLGDVERRGLSSKYLLLTRSEETPAGASRPARAQERNGAEADAEAGVDASLPEGLQAEDLPLVGEEDAPADASGTAPAAPGDGEAPGDASEAEGAPAPAPGSGEPSPAEATATAPQAAVVAAAPEDEKAGGTAELVRDLLETRLREDGLLLPAGFSSVRWAPDASPGAVTASEYLEMEVNLVDVQTSLTTDRIREDLNAAFAADPAFNDDPINPGVLTDIRVAAVEMVGQPTEAEGVTRYRVRTTPYVPPLATAGPDDKRPRKAQVEELVRSYFNSPPEVDGNALFALSEPFSRVETVSGSTASDLQTTAVIALFIAMLGIVFYVSLRFEFSFGLGAVAALAHDVLVGIGLTAVTDQFFGGVFPVKINLSEIAAILTIIGFSINDTIVIFDRIRENVQIIGKKKMTLREIVDLSINQTLSRTIWTSLTTLLVLLALLFFGGASVQGFAYIFCIGVVAGTYSTLFIACPIVIWLHDRSDQRRRLAEESGMR